jgi:hypothetical protein
MNTVMILRAEVCTDLGLVAQIMFGFGPGSSLVQMIAIKRYSFSVKKK